MKQVRAIPTPSANQSEVAPYPAASALSRAGLPLTDLFTVAKHSRMKLTWKDHEEIAWALMDQFPDQDPLRLSFPKLHKMVTELDEFSDKPDASNEKILENIQMAWYEEKK